jgi:hypothetical protein
MPKSIKDKSVIKCPICKYKKEIPIPVGSLLLYDCEECKARLKPKNEECCVLCSYGTVPCLKTQKERASGSPKGRSAP